MHRKRKQFGAPQADAVVVQALPAQDHEVVLPDKPQSRRQGTAGDLSEDWTHDPSYTGTSYVQQLTYCGQTDRQTDTDTLSDNKGRL